MRLALLTPSYIKDFDICSDLIRSVLRNTESDVEHHIIVPKSDVPAFKSLAGSRTIISDTRSYLPSSMKQVSHLNAWINYRAPFPPIRGWMAQQIVKLAAAARSQSDVVLLIDSDVLLIRQVSASSFYRSGRLKLFEMPSGIDASLPRHHLWHATARRLLGLPPYKASTLPDYICWPCAWQPSVVRTMLARVEAVTGLPWPTAVGKELNFSEMILYGVYVREVVGASEELALSDDMHCVNHSHEIALTERQLSQMLSSAKPEDFAIMISAKSGTPLSVRRRFLNQLI